MFEINNLLNGWVKKDGVNANLITTTALTSNALLILPSVLVYVTDFGSKGAIRTLSIGLPMSRRLNMVMPPPLEIGANLSEGSEK